MSENRFGEYLRAQRKIRGWTQPVLAAKLGVDETATSNWELGKNFPSMKTFHKLAKVLGMRPGELFAYTSETPLRGGKTK